MLIDGTAIAQEIQAEIKSEVNRLTGRRPCLAVVRVGEDPASKIYVSRKIKACEEAGIISRSEHHPNTITEHQLLGIVHKLNQDHTVDGILVQLPLPDSIDAIKITQAIDPAKDVDGFHPINVGKMLMGSTDGYLPCTPLGIKTLLERYSIPVSGKHVVILGRSNIVGKPLAAILMQNQPGCNATVTVAHSKTERLREVCLNADILIVAIGKPQFLKADMVKEGAVVIDVGINRLPSKALVGDVDFEHVQPKCSYITPVPGGVGPMTIAMLLSNTLKSYRQTQNSPQRYRGTEK
jgi:methylenetetrahydrofolate dehydrogenase (NADP+)/methenyltetrahydrofolate cyclohydrolase